jgi:hypothetical protein
VKFQIPILPDGVNSGDHEYTEYIPSKYQTRPTIISDVLRVDCRVRQMCDGARRIKIANKINPLGILIQRKTSIALIKP